MSGRLSLLLVIAALTLLAGAGCRKEVHAPDQKHTPEVSTAVPTTAPDSGKTETAHVVPLPEVAPEIQSLLGLAGDGYLFTLLFHPGRWDASRKAFAPLFSSLASIAPHLAAVTGTTSPEALPHTIFQALGVDGFPAALPGWDTSLPVVFALFRADDAPGSTSDLISAWHDPTNGPTGIRSRVVIPASDPTALTTSLLAFLDKMVQGESGPNIFPVLQRGALYDFGQGWIAVRPLEQAVLVEVQLADGFRDPDEESRIKRINQWLQPEKSEPEMTPALHHAATATGLASAHVNLHLLRSTSIHYGLQVTGRALRSTSEDHRLFMQAMALSSLGSAWALMGPDGLLVQDISIAVTFDQGVAVSAVSTLTPRGHDAMKSAWHKRGKRLLAASGSNLAKLDFNLSTRTLVDAASPLLQATPQAEGMEDPKGKLAAILDAHRLCGPACSLHLLAGGWASVAASFPSELTLAPLPQAARLTLQYPKGTTRLLPSLFLAVQVEPGFDTLVTRQMFAELGKALPMTPLMQATSVEKTQWLTFGFNGAPDQAFDNKMDHLDAPHLLQLVLSATSLAAALGPHIPQLATLFDKLETCTLTMDLDGPAVRTVARLALKNAHPLPEQAGYQDYNWTHKAPPVTDAKADFSLLWVAQDLNMLNDLPEQLGILDQVLARLEKTGDPGKLRPYVADFGARLAQSLLDLDRRDQYLRHACAGGVQSACKPEQQPGYLPAVRLATLPQGCSPLKVPANHVDFAITPDGFRFESRNIPTDKSDTLEQELGKVLASRGKHTPAFVLVDQATPFELFKTFYLALQNAGAESMHAVFREENGTVSAVTLRLPADFKMDLDVDIQVGNLSVGINPTDSSDVDLIEFDLEGQPRFAQRLREKLGPKLPTTVVLGALNDTPWKNFARTVDALVCGDEATNISLIYLEAPPPEDLKYIRRHALVKEHVFPKLVGSVEGNAIDLLADHGQEGLGAALEDTLVAEAPELETKKKEKDIASGVVYPPLDRQVARVLRRHQKALRRCYEKRLKVQPTLTAKVVLRFDVNEKGRPDKVEVLSDSSNDSALHKCLLKVCRSMRFPPPKDKKTRTFKVPIIFRSN